MVMLRAVLEAEGHTVLSAHDAKGALAHIAEASREVDLVIQDLALPDRAGTWFAASHKLRIDSLRSRSIGFFEIEQPQVGSLSE
jgi:DNA-binding response OmpR family regulator